MTIQIAYPDELLALPDLTYEQLEHLARETLLVRLYELGMISTGKAADLLGIARREFLDLLGQYGISEFDDDIDLAAEMQRG